MQFLSDEPKGSVNEEEFWMKSARNVEKNRTLTPREVGRGREREQQQLQRTGSFRAAEQKELSAFEIPREVQKPFHVGNVPFMP